MGNLDYDSDDSDNDESSDLDDENLNKNPFSNCKESMVFVFID